MSDEISKRQMAEWDNEFFNHLDSQIDAYLDRQWEESETRQRELHCWAEPEGGGWTCMALKHDDGRHFFVKDSRITVSGSPANE